MKNKERGGTKSAEEKKKKKQDLIRDNLGLGLKDAKASLAGSSYSAYMPDPLPLTLRELVYIYAPQFWNDPSVQRPKDAWDTQRGSEYLRSLTHGRGEKDGKIVLVEMAKCANNLELQNPAAAQAWNDAIEESGGKKYSQGDGQHSVDFLVGFVLNEKPIDCGGEKCYFDDMDRKHQEDLLNNLSLTAVVLKNITPKQFAQLFKDRNSMAKMSDHNRRQSGDELPKKKIRDLSTKLIERGFPASAAWKRDRKLDEIIAAFVYWEQIWESTGEMPGTSVKVDKATLDRFYVEIENASTPTSAPEETEKALSVTEDILQQAWYGVTKEWKDKSSKTLSALAWCTFALHHHGVFCLPKQPKRKQAYVSYVVNKLSDIKIKIKDFLRENTTPAELQRAQWEEVCALESRGPFYNLFKEPANAKKMVDIFLFMIEEEWEEAVKAGKVDEFKKATGLSRKRKTQHNFTKKQRLEALEKHDYEISDIDEHGKEFKRRITPYQYAAGLVDIHGDHKIPHDKGGDNTVDNCVPSTASYNLSKGNKEPS